MTSKMKAALLWIFAVYALALGLYALSQSSILAGSANLRETLTNATQNFGTFLLFSLFIGITAMSVLEAFKSLLFLRGFFYQVQVPRLADISKNDLGRILSTNRPQRNLLAARLDMPVGQLAGQLASKIDAGINDFGMQIDSHHAMNGRSHGLGTMRLKKEEDLDVELNKPNWVLSMLLGEQFTQLEKMFRSGRLSETDSTSLLVDLRETAESRLDALQVSLRANWRWFMRFAVSSLSAIIAVVVSPYTGFFDAILVAGSSFVVAGFMATALYDMLTLLRPPARS